MRALAATALCLVVFAPLASTLGAQAAPAGVASPLYRGFQIPTVKGTLTYSVSASESADFNYDGGDQTAYFTNLSGNLAYLSPSLNRPTRIVYSGGFLGSNVNQPSTFFQNFSVQQILNTKHWKFTVTDSVNYLPNSPSTGFSGIPGVGDVGVVTGVDVQQSELSPYETRIDNLLTGNASRSLTGKTSIFFSGGYTLERFLGSDAGIDSDSDYGSGGISHRINGRSSVSASYNYSRFSYGALDGNFISQGGSLSYNRALTRSLQVSLSGGPQYLEPSALSGTSSTLSYNADAHLTYSGSVRSGSAATLSFVRATNSGSGFTFGAQTTSVSLTASRRFSRAMQLSAQINYGRNAGLPFLGIPSLDTDTLAFSIQANRALGRTLSAFVSYSGSQQTSSGTPSVLNYAPIQGFTNTISAGLTYSPRSFHTGR